jgi:hypothetical protein
VKRNGKTEASFKAPAGLRYSHGDLVGPEGPLPPALVGLLASIPTSEGWTSAAREKFMIAFGHVLDFTVPIREKTPDIDDDDSDDEE